MVTKNRTDSTRKLSKTEPKATGLNRNETNSRFRTVLLNICLPAFQTHTETDRINFLICFLKEPMYPFHLVCSFKISYLLLRTRWQSPIFFVLATLAPLCSYLVIVGLHCYGDTHAPTIKWALNTPFGVQIN